MYYCDYIAYLNTHCKKRENITQQYTKQENNPRNKTKQKEKYLSKFNECALVVELLVFHSLTNKTPLDTQRSREASTK